MDSIMSIRNEIAAATDTAQRRIEGMWSVDCLFNPAGNGRVFNYKFLLAQTTGLGCAYSTRTDYPVPELESYVNRDFLSLDLDDTALNVALLDSAYAACSPVQPVVWETADGPSVRKMRWRSELILHEAERLLGSIAGKRVVNVGVVGDILTAFTERGAHITGTDFDPSIVGRRMFDSVEIIDGARTLDVIAESELCVVTGMTIATRTIDGIIERCRVSGTKIIVFAETGANLGGYYVAHGVDAYLSEVFPFYIFNGPSRIAVYRGE